MEMPSTTSSSDVLLDTYGDYHVSALGAEPRAADILAEFSERQTALRTAMEAREAAERTETACMALRDRAERDVEQIIRQIELLLFGAVEKKRERDPYRRVFPQALGGAVAPVGAAQAAEGRRIASLLAPTEGAPVPGLPEGAARLGEELRARCGVLDERVTAWVRAGEAVNAAFGLELSERRRWREQYRKDEGRLIALFPDDPRLVESFFRSAKRAKNKKTE